MIYARAIQHNKIKHIYLPGKQEGIFNIDYLEKMEKKELILCESVIDAVSIYLSGYKNVSCFFGINSSWSSFI